MYIAPHPIPAGLAHAVELLQERALGVGGESSSISNVLAETTSSTATTTSNGPFFTSGSIGGQSDSGSDSGGQTDVTKTALEWVFAIAALFAIASVTTWRYAQIRRKNRGIRNILPRPRGSHAYSTGGAEGIQERRRSLPRTTGLPRPGSLSGEPLPASMGPALFYPPSISHGRYPVLLEPAAVHLAGRRGRNRDGSRRAAQGADIDAQGRRGGRRDSTELDGDDKDELPAYESAAVGSPPRYGDEDLHYLGGVPMRTTATPMPESTEREWEVAIEQALQRLPSEDSVDSETLASQEHNRADVAPEYRPSTPAASSASHLHLPQNSHPC